MASSVEGGVLVGQLRAATKISPTGLERLIDEYLAACRARGLALRTVKEAYRYPLYEVFLPFCAEQGIEEPGQVTGRVLDRLTTHLLDAGGRRGQLSRFTVASYVRAINAFLGWARREGEVGEGVKAQAPKLPRRLLDVLSRDEISRLEDAAKTERDKLIVRVLADSGIRVTELTSLRVTDLIERDRRAYLRVLGKGDKQRDVPLMPQLGRRLRRHIERGRPRGTTADRVFVSLRRSRHGDHEPLTRSGVDQLVRLLGEEAGLEKRVHPHLLRHSFATWALTRGMNPIQLAQIMGHSSLAMIQSVYAHLTPQDAYAALEQIVRTDM
jgi:integrase/recombinase XerD